MVEVKRGVNGTMQKKYISVRTKSDDPKLTFRVPKELKSELQSCANRTGRTLNAEVIIRLVKSLNLHELITEAPSLGE